MAREQCYAVPNRVAVGEMQTERPLSSGARWRRPESRVPARGGKPPPERTVAATPRRWRGRYRRSFKGRSEGGLSYGIVRHGRGGRWRQMGRGAVRPPFSFRSRSIGLPHANRCYFTVISCVQIICCGPAEILYLPPAPVLLSQIHAS